MQDQRVKAAVAWAMVGMVKSGFIDMWLENKNKGDNHVIISLWLVISLVVFYAVATTNLAFNKLLKITKLIL